MDERKAYAKPVLSRVNLRPGESVLAYCETVDDYGICWFDFPTPPAEQVGPAS